MNIIKASYEVRSTTIESIDEVGPLGCMKSFVVCIRGYNFEDPTEGLQEWVYSLSGANDNDCGMEKKHGQ